MTLTKANGHIGLDFTATDDQAKGAVNFIMDDSVPSFMAGLYLTMDEPGIAMNDGFTRAIDKVETRKGSLVDPVFPAPLGMRSHTMIRVNSVLFGGPGPGDRRQRRGRLRLLRALLSAQSRPHDRPVRALHRRPGRRFRRPPAC